METFGLSRPVAAMTLLMIITIVAFAVFWFFHSAPPHTITITTGPPGSTFETNAMLYARILASKGVTLKILPSEGSFENLQRLENPAARI